MIRESRRRWRWRTAARPDREPRRRPRPPHSAHGVGAAARGARARGSDGAPRDHRPARRPRGTPLAGGAGVTTASAEYGRVLDLVTRVHGVRGAMLVAGDDGLVVAEQLMEGIKGPAVAALAASLATRLRRALQAPGRGAGRRHHGLDR